MARLRSHGITRDPARMTREPDGPWYYEQLELGYNYRMTDIQAALGHSQLERLDEFLAKREAIAGRYDEALAGLPLRLPARQADRRSAWHLYVVRLAREQGTPPSRLVHEQLRGAGIGVNLHYIPIYRQPSYQRSRVQFNLCPAAEAYYAEAVSLPQFAALESAAQERVIDILARILGR
jgi:dTDP-4-amino-4,6-dideoxygalactose transaminase